MKSQTNQDSKKENFINLQDQIDSSEKISMVLFKDNAAPRVFTLPIEKIRRVLMVISAILILLILGIGITSSQWLITKRAYHKALKDGPSQTGSTESTAATEDNTANSLSSLSDKNEQLEQRLKNLTLQMNTPQNLESHSSILALFSPIVTDKTKEQDRVSTKNFSFAMGQGKEPSVLTFELHNNHPDSAVEKGYIVVLKKEKGIIYSYPNVFNEKGTFLLDFEKGESFQVSRFRLVNAQFDLAQSKEKNHAFQVLIFRRNGELLLNLLTEVTSK